MWQAVPIWFTYLTNHKVRLDALQPSCCRCSRGARSHRWRGSRQIEQDRSNPNVCPEKRVLFRGWRHPRSHRRSFLWSHGFSFRRNRIWRKGGSRRTSLVCRHASFYCRRRRRRSCRILQNRAPSGREWKPHGLRDLTRRPEIWRVEKGAARDAGGIAKLSYCASGPCHLSARPILAISGLFGVLPDRSP